MREIEIKMKVDDLKPIADALEAIGCVLAEPIIQKDIVFRKDNEEPNVRNILRIRSVNNKNIFTLKRNVSDELDCLEKETEISNPEELKDIIELLGYKEFVRINKKRWISHYKDYEICLDEVDNLGCFVEMEKLEEISENIIEGVRQEMIDFLISLGIDSENIVRSGYDTLMSQNKKI